MKIGILQPGYLPWLGFFEQIYKTDLFAILDDVQYDKKSWRNRNKIRTKDGWIWLTVPVLTKGAFSQQIKDVKINNDLSWQRKHLKAIEINYNQAPFYKDYIDFFKEIYSKKWENLVELDMVIVEFIMKQLNLTTKLLFSSSLGVSGNKNEKILNICKQLKADILYDGASAENFIDKEMFSKEGVNIEFQHYEHPVYPQIFKPFIPYMSVVDLLFNCGPQSMAVINQK